MDSDWWGSVYIAKEEIEMNKKIVSVIVAIVMTIGLTACGDGYASVENVYDESGEKEENSTFVVVEKTSTWTIVYHKETKVMYAVSNGYYNTGTFTVLVDESGTPLLYKESSMKGEK